MIDFVLKFYRRVSPALASKVIGRADIRAPDRKQAIEQARELFHNSEQDAEFAMLFIKGGNFVWISEPAMPKGPDGVSRPSDVNGDAAHVVRVNPRDT